MKIWYPVKFRGILQSGSRKLTKFKKSRVLQELKLLQKLKVLPGLRDLAEGQIIFLLILIMVIVFSGTASFLPFRLLQGPVGKDSGSVRAEDFQAEEIFNPAELEIFSWWTAPGEREGLEYLINSFQEEYPEIEVVNAAVEGGAGVNAKDVLKIRLLRNIPPDTFQVHAGAELKDTFIAGDYLNPLTELWQEQGWQEVFPEKLTEMVRKKGEYYSLPVTAHRSNRLWYNKEMLADYGLQPPRTPDELLSTVKALAEKDEIPLALGSRNLWPITHLFETLLAALAEPEQFEALVRGERSWGSPEVERTLEIMQELLTHVNEDHASLSWHEACELILQREAALTVMGTWARGYFAARNASLDEDYGSVVLAGENQVFLLVVDTFAMPAATENQSFTRKWLEFISRREIQGKFTEILGAAPPRSDIKSEELISGTREDHLDLLNQQNLLPSIAHGAAAREVFVNALNQELNVFLYENDISGTLEELKLLAEIYLIP